VITAGESDAGDTRIIPFEPSDLDRMMEIENVSFTPPWTRKSYEDLSVLDTVEIWVAKIGDELVGYMLVQRIKDEMELHTFAVAPERRRRNIGRKLLNHLCELAKEHRIVKVFLQVRPSNESARAIYSEFGFEALGVRHGYYTDGEDAFVLVKMLVPQP
jgi:[ribosomal protein S18]-alanine N-acetyltransferase